MKKLSFAAFLASFVVACLAFAQGPYPIGPDAGLTPGAFCTSPTEYRYPEHIPYCARKVSTDLKNFVIHNYDVKLGYQIESLDRQDFKIDHYIPLCAGGANSVGNLWPQHKSVFTITDPLEQDVCIQMAAGKLSQKDAVALIRSGKANLASVPAILAHVHSL